MGHGDQGKKSLANGGDEQKGDLPSGHESGGELDWGWGATVDLQKKPASKAGDPVKYEVAVLVMCKPEDGARGKEYIPPTPQVRNERIGALTHRIAGRVHGRMRRLCNVMPRKLNRWQDRGW